VEEWTEKEIPTKRKGVRDKLREREKEMEGKREEQKRGEIERECY
jgi:hypothetical protein